VKDGKQEKRAVTIGTRDAGFTEIKKGVNEKEQVVINRVPEKVDKSEKP
jgi:hypothetical protein